MELSSGGMGALRGVEHYLNVESGLPSVLLEFVRLRASLLNGCHFCIGLHTRELRRHNEPESRIGAVADWEGSAAFTERERAALRWTEIVTELAGEGVPQRDFDALGEHFEDKEIVDLTLAVASINAWNRIAIAFGSEWDEAKAGARAAAAPIEEGCEAAISAGVMSDDGERAVVNDDGDKVHEE
jgi:AhpD family alkylhydroperoxidase